MQIDPVHKFKFILSFDNVCNGFHYYLCELSFWVVMNVKETAVVSTKDTTFLQTYLQDVVSLKQNFIDFIPKFENLEKMNDIYETMYNMMGTLENIGDRVLRFYSLNQFKLLIHALDQLRIFASGFKSYNEKKNVLSLIVFEEKVIQCFIISATDFPPQLLDTDYFFRRLKLQPFEQSWCQLNRACQMHNLCSTLQAAEVGRAKQR